MYIGNQQALQRLLAACSKQLADLAPNTAIRSSAKSEVPYNFVAIKNELTLKDIDLSGIPSLIYGNPHMTEALATYIWRQCVDAYRLPSKKRADRVYALISTAFPHLPLHNSLVVQRQAINMLRYIYAVSWNFGTLTLNTDQCLLHYGDLIGFDHQGVELAGTYRRCRQRHIENYSQSLMSTPSFRGGRALLTPRLAALYKALKTWLPHLSKQIELVLFTAFSLGAEYEELVMCHFPIHTVPGDLGEYIPR